MKQTEDQFQRAVIELAQRCGRRVAHFRKARTKAGNWITPVAGDGAGFPDLVIVLDDEVLFAELKTDKGKVTHGQVEWIEALRKAGQRAEIWRPRDWPYIEETLKR